MRISVAVATVLVLAAGTLARQGGRWERMLPSGSGAWQEGWVPGRVRLEIKPSATSVAGDAAWLNDVWASSDGEHWTREQDAPWSARAPIYSTVFRNRFWLFGGKGIEASGRGGFADDVWTMF